MKKSILLLLLTIIVIFGISGCRGKKSDYGFETTESLVYIQDKNSIISIFIEEFDKKTYNLEDLNKAIEEEVKEYNESIKEKDTDEDGLEFLDLDLKDTKARLEMEYKSPEDYAAYNTKYVYYGEEVIMHLGSFDELAKKEISVDGDFNKIDETGEISTVTLNKIQDKDNLTVLLINEGNKVRVNGTILYTSKNVSVKDEVATTTSGEYNYIIYAQKEVK